MTTQTMQERSGVTTARGNPLTLQGNELKIGDAAPETSLTTADFSTKTLDDLTDHGKRAALLICVPSLDTSVCSKESSTFNQRLGELPDTIKAYVVSMDLPFAQQRWSTDGQGDVKLEFLSDYRDHAFGYDYGLRVKENGLISRSFVIVGKDKKIAYIDVVPELTSEPDYDAVIAAANKAAR